MIWMVGFVLTSNLLAATEVSPFFGKKKVVFLITEDPNNYEAHRTIPVFAQQLTDKYGIETRLLEGKGALTRSSFDQLESILEADLVVVFCRRLALIPEQMNIIKTYVQSGKPILGIRTANHAFSVRSEPAPGYEDYWDFVPHVLGANNMGYGKVEAGTKVRVTATGEAHPSLQGVSLENWHSTGNVYLNKLLLDSQTNILLWGKGDGEEQPIAWTRKTFFGGQVFYTSLGHPSDFDYAPFVKFLNQAILWMLQQ